MQLHSRRHFCFGLAIAALAILPLGCRKSKPEAAVSTGGPQAAPRVELSDPQVTVLEPQKVRVAVKYRFVEGRPAAGIWYTVLAKLSYGENAGGVSLLQSEGSRLAVEGTMQNEFGMFKPIPKGAAVAFELEMQQGQKDHFEKKISNTLKGTVH